MFCKNCGNEIQENQKFCKKCGAFIVKPTEQAVVSDRQITQPVSPMLNNNKPASPIKTVINERASEKVKTKISKASKAKIICIAVFVAIAVAFVSLVAMYFTSPAYSVYKNLKDVDCSTAIREYNSSVEDSFVQKMFIKIALNGYSEKILSEFKDGEMNFEDSLSILEAMKEMGIKDIEKTIDEVNRLNEAKSAFDSANKYYEDGDYENAIKEYSKITDSDLQFTDAQAKLTELYPKYASTISEKAKQLASSGDYAGALSLINTALGILPDGSAGKSELSQTKSDCLNTYKKEIIDNATAMIAEKSYVDAINYMNKAISVDDNEDFQNIKTTAEKEYVNSVTATVNDFIKQEDYISASRSVKAALDVLPNNSSIIALQKTVTDATPTYLLDVCKPYSSYWYDEYIAGETFTMGGKQYTNGFVLGTAPSTSGYALFNIEGNYNTLSFKIGHSDESDMNDTDVKIYCDGVLKETYTINCETLPQTISIDITGVKQIKIEACNASDWNTRYGFGNVTVK